MDYYDAIFWVAAETSIVLRQSFTNIALALKLLKAHPQNHEENMVLVLVWLKTTKTRWLLIFDNVEDARIFDDYWPVAKSGSVLVTTRQESAATQPNSVGIEIETFSVEEGAEFLKHLLPRHDDSKHEGLARLELSSKLGGHALAINQMAALMYFRGMSVTHFVPYYERHTHELHRERRAGWKYDGYNHALDTVWLISFKSLSWRAKTCLSIFVFLDPDRIPGNLFELSEDAQPPTRIWCLTDDYDRLEILEDLSHFGLVKHDIKTNMYSLHRLVQAEFLYQLGEKDRQVAFDCATYLLHLVFPSRANGVVSDKQWPVAQLYMHSYHRSQSGPENIKTTTAFCDLLADASWYLVSHDDMTVEGEVCTIILEATKRLTETKKNMLIRSFLLCHAALDDMHFGRFNEAEARMKENLAIATKYIGPDKQELVTNVYNNAAQVAASKCLYKHSHMWWMRAEDIFNRQPEPWPEKNIKTNISLARNFYCTGKYVEARRRLDLALKYAREAESPYFVTHVHQAYATLLYRVGDYEGAQAQIDHSIAEMKASGNGRGPLAAFLAYRAGRILPKRGYHEAAVAELEKSAMIEKRCKTLVGRQARCAFALYEALAAKGDMEAAEEPKQRAQRLRRQAPTYELMKMDEDSEEAYDRLVFISMR